MTVEPSSFHTKLVHTVTLFVSLQQCSHAKMFSSENLTHKRVHSHDVNKNEIHMSMRSSSTLPLFNGHDQEFTL